MHANLGRFNREFAGHISHQSHCFSHLFTPIKDSLPHTHRLQSHRKHVVLSQYQGEKEKVGRRRSSTPTPARKGARITPVLEFVALKTVKGLLCPAKAQNQKHIAHYHGDVYQNQHHRKSWSAHRCLALAMNLRMPSIFRFLTRSNDAFALE